MRLTKPFTRALIPHRDSRLGFLPCTCLGSALNVPWHSLTLGRTREADTSQERLRILLMTGTCSFERDSSFFITSRTPGGLLTTCRRQGELCCFAARGAAHDAQPPGLQQPEAVTDIALRTGQNRDECRVTTRHHPMGPLLIGRSPAQDTFLEWCQTDRSHHGSPDVRGGGRVSRGDDGIGWSSTCLDG